MIHPADELALLRIDIDRLKQREAFLRKGFLGQSLSCHGANATVEITSFRQRRFRHDLLPSLIRDDSFYWQEDQIKQVTVRPR